jgi:hypothetical protein
MRSILPCASSPDIRFTTREIAGDAHTPIRPPYFVSEKEYAPRAGIFASGTDMRVGGFRFVARNPNGS